jgi:DNA-binding NarL/FixJ family response regulator
MSFTLVIADDHDIIREGIKGIVCQDPNFKVVGEAIDGQDALEKVRELKPDILLLDITMPKISGLDVIEQIHHVSSGTKIIIVSVHKMSMYVRKAIKLGVKGYLHKENAADELLAALQRVSRGETYLSPDISSFVLEEALSKEETEKEVFTDREEDILRLIVEGKTAKEIAKILYISPRTVENYKNKLLKKLNLHRTSDLIKYVLEHKLLD